MEVARQAAGYIAASKRHNAFVLDDSIQVRYGKKMPGVSSHFDHCSGRHVMGQQVLTLGLSSAEGFVPIDTQVMETIERHVQSFCVQSLQLDVSTLRMEAK